MIKQAANFLTLSNLFVGCTSIVFLFEQQYMYVFGLLFVAGLLDFFDGLVARWTGSDGQLGGQLDSLADIVSFGVVPGMIAFHLLSLADTLSDWLAFLGFLIPVFGAVRLAKFNLLEDHAGDFIGLATPAMTGFWAGLILILHYHPEWQDQWLFSPIAIYIMIVLCCVLMVSSIPMVSMKFKGRGWSGNELRYIFPILFVLSLLFLKEWAFSLIVVIYVLVSILLYWIKRSSKN